MNERRGCYMAEHKAKDMMQQFAIKQALSYLEKDPEKMQLN